MMLCFQKKLLVVSLDAKDAIQEDLDSMSSLAASLFNAATGDNENADSLDCLTEVSTWHGHLFVNWKL